MEPAWSAQCKFIRLIIYNQSTNKSADASVVRYKRILHARHALLHGASIIKESSIVCIMISCSGFFKLPQGPQLKKGIWQSKQKPY